MADADTLTVEEAAALLRLKPDLVRSMAARSLIPASRAAAVGSDWCFSMKLLLEYAAADGSPPAPVVEIPPAAIAEARPRSRVLTIEQAAELLQVRPKTLRALAHEGSVPAVKVGKPWRFDENLLLEWVERRARENEARMPAPCPASPPQLIHSLRLKADEGSLADRLDRMLQASPGAVPAARRRQR